MSPSRGYYFHLQCFLILWHKISGHLGSDNLSFFVPVIVFLYFCLFSQNYWVSFVSKEMFDHMPEVSICYFYYLTNMAHNAYFVRVMHLFHFFH